MLIGVRPEPFRKMVDVLGGIRGSVAFIEACDVAKLDFVWFHGANGVEPLLGERTDGDWAGEDTCRAICNGGLIEKDAVGPVVRGGTEGTSLGVGPRLTIGRARGSTLFGGEAAATGIGGGDKGVRSCARRSGIEIGALCVPASIFLCFSSAIFAFLVFSCSSLSKRSSSSDSVRTTPFRISLT